MTKNNTMIKPINVKKEEIEPNIIKKTFDLYNDGGCQCFSDCDCYKNKGIVQTEIITYNNRRTIEEARFILQQAQENRERKEKDVQESILWKTTISMKELFKIIDAYKKQNKTLKSYNHREILEDNNKYLQVYYWWKKYYQTV